MVRHNNMLPHGHFHKKWQIRVKTWFDQPFNKVQREVRRAKKFMKMAPKPRNLLRPTVYCPSARYNSKLRSGRGFTLQELKQAGLNRNYARTIGIAVDHRRRNRCVESLHRNVLRLQEYGERLVLCPSKCLETDSEKDLNVVTQIVCKVNVRKIAEEDKKFGAYTTLRRARSDAKRSGVRNRKRNAKKEACEGCKV